MAPPKASLPTLLLRIRSLKDPPPHGDQAHFPLIPGWQVPVPPTCRIIQEATHILPREPGHPALQSLRPPGPPVTTPSSQSLCSPVSHYALQSLRPPVTAPSSHYTLRSLRTCSPALRARSPALWVHSALRASPCGPPCGCAGPSIPGPECSWLPLSSAGHPMALRQHCLPHQRVQRQRASLLPTCSLQGRGLRGVCKDKAVSSTHPQPSHVLPGQ